MPLARYVSDVWQLAEHSGHPPPRPTTGSFQSPASATFKF